MSKKHKSSQFPTSRSNPPNQSPAGQNGNLIKPNSMPNSTPALQEAIAPSEPSRIKPEQISLDAHHHIQKYLEISHKSNVDKNDLNAVLRLSQHLRVFGLLSAVGYLNQSNAQENNETRKRTFPVWRVLLGQMSDEINPPGTRKLMEIEAPNEMARELMKEVVKMANERPSEYMASWRKSLNLSNQWNFWARAYQED
ncbi:hypothetical protein [Argonema galeatum]|uniref:hypothetical protein n=1 Tax=Argonema galeatum TaxID=2942762 RepID=UPI0020134488|nr:hypothetical protein [Argonema galeatum]MCL1463263.1 hypothetical protein [Argonema galeatum A003/A1]